MKIVNEFKAFIKRGNVIDLAVGIIIGAAFGKIVSSFVNDVMMPPIGLILGGLDFSDFALVLREAAGDVPAITIKYGVFISMIIDFLIVAFAVFLVVKVVNKLKKEEEAKPAPPPPVTKEAELLGEIRDILKAK
ncbi:MAG TPA: large-conductance mechanosensitive channel protein MscL [Ignavibacteriaceae bacterium]|nr:large-conductance mechanosensitive channel protein MscL [Ignavibacteriaceae bacterium]